MKNIMIAQSGGPTAAINSTVAGIISGALASGSVEHIYGSMNGILGVIEKRYVDLSDQMHDTVALDMLSKTPAAALGSCRYKLKTPEENPDEYWKMIENLRELNVGYFFYIGGNDSMDTVDKLSRFCVMNDVEDIKIIGAPKTIDNDLPEIDHCPGFGSAAKYIATTFAELVRDCNVYDMPAVTIVECMGRNAGWLTAASALSRLNGDRGPSLIYLCEKAFSVDRFIEDVKEQLAIHPVVVVAVSEGLKDENGVYISESQQSGAVDVFGHSYIAGAGRFLEDQVRAKIGCKVRSIELNLMQRCASHIASRVDLEESKMLGLHAFQCAMEGMTGVMASIVRESNDPYRVCYRRVRVRDVANNEKTVPLDWITPDGHDVTQEMMDYLKPLIQGEIMPTYENGVPKYLVL